MFDYKVEARKFIDKYPTYAKQVLDFEELAGRGIKFNLKDGKSFIYYPLEENLDGLNN